MKKFVNLTIIMSIILTFNACKKDKTLTEVKNTDPTEQKILNFKAQMQNPNKSNESMSIDSAVWYIEAALNYDYCDTANNVIGMDSIVVNVSLNENGELDFNDIIETYNRINNNLTAIVGENGIRIADVEFIDNYDKSGQEEFKLTVVETKAQIPQYYDLNFDWHSGAGGCLMGRCDETHNDKSAATVWSNAISVFLGVPADGYFTDIRMGTSFTNTNAFSTPPVYDYYLYKKYSDSSPCIVSELMQFYYDHGREIVNSYNPPQGWGKAYVEYITYYNGFPGWIWTQLTVYEGKIHYYNQSEL